MFENEALVLAYKKIIRQIWYQLFKSSNKDSTWKIFALLYLCLVSTKASHETISFSLFYFVQGKKKRTSRCIYCPPYCHFVYQYSKYFLLILANDRHLFICLWRGFIHHLDRKSPRWAFIQDNDFLSGFQNR